MTFSLVLIPVNIYLFYRYILAALHFNHNLRRENKLDQNGQHRLRVTYMKYEEGEETDIYGKNKTLVCC